jgi:hypothetical protein
LKQFGKKMSRHLAISYRGFRHLWFGSEFRSFNRSYKGCCLAVWLGRLPLYVLRCFQQITAILDEQV